ncbi:hypothetical protein OXYTRIMIC_429 [Oxytricha trifallax]|uniref:Uncharacterized protein n=1 Tax=Oxytricha trifallax TaxID=1172189 RepID=A0A073HZY6_9SPIT|nr:hypothetical protein OXYTRIMIC_429 [Oxytricha trifallax]
MCRRLHLTEAEILTFKRDNGISLQQMKDVVADSNHLYSPSLIFEWEMSKDSSHCNEFEQVIEQSKSRQFIMIYRNQAISCSYSHALTLKKCSKGLAVFYSARTAPQYSKIDKCAQRWDTGDFMNGVTRIQLFEMTPDDYSEEERAKQMTALQGIMTGSYQTPIMSKNILSKRNKKSNAKKLTSRKKSLRALRPPERENSSQIVQSN